MCRAAKGCGIATCHWRPQTGCCEVAAYSEKDIPRNNVLCESLLKLQEGNDETLSPHPNVFVKGGWAPGRICLPWFKVH